MRNLKRWLGLFIFIIAGVFGWLFLHDRPNQTQPLKVLVVFQEDEARILLEKFKQQQNQPYEIMRMASGEASYQLLTMNQIGIDVVLGGPADLHEQLKLNNKLLKYAPKNSELIPDAYKDPDKYWTGIYTGPLAIGVNKEAWQQDPELVSLSYPQTYEDLLKPQLQGKLDIPNPETSGTGYTLLASLEQERGTEAALSLMHQLKQQSSAVHFSGITAAQRLAMGEATVAISFLGDQLRFANSGYSIHSIVPSNAGWEIGAVSILKTSNNRNAAKKLVDFMLSNDAQIYYMNTAFSIPAQSNIELNDTLRSVDMGQFLESYRFDLAAARRSELLASWKEKNSQP